MANKKSSFVRRPSLLPPHERNENPNATMVDSARVPKTLMQHPRQCDKDIETDQEQAKQLAEQRLSLIKAVKVVEDWHKRSSSTDTRKQLHTFYTPPMVSPNRTTQIKQFFIE